MLINFADRTGLIKLKRLIFKYFNYSRVIYINKKRVVLPSIFGINSVDSIFSEMWMFELLGKILVETKGTFLDIGVNVGQTLVKVKSLEPDCNYIGFEPNPTCVFYVNELIKSNNFSKCKLIPVALFSDIALLSLEIYTEDPSDASASLISEFRPGSTIQTKLFVPAFNYESVASKLDIDTVGIVKIDVEGAEMEVLKSLSGMIRHDNPFILVEVVPTYDIPFRIERQNKIAKFLDNHDYKIYSIRKTSNNGFAGLTSISIFSNNDDPSQMDYIAFPDNKISNKLATLFIK